MADENVLLDKGIIAKAANDFTGASTEIRSLMTRLNSDLDSAIGSPEAFNGAERLAFEQAKLALNEQTTKVNNELNAIADRFNEVMNTHTGLADEAATKVAQLAAPLHGNVVGVLNA